jgi:hypothetical protein
MMVVHVVSDGPALSRAYGVMVLMVFLLRVWVAMLFKSCQVDEEWNRGLND